MNARTPLIEATVLAALLLAISSPASANPERCGTPHPTAAEMDQVTSRVAKLRATSPLATQFHGGTIHVAIHVITNGSVGAVSDDQIAAQMREVNQNFAGTGYRFDLISVDRTDKTSWFKMGIGTGAEKDAKRTLAIDPAHTMNVYICNASKYLGWAYFPWSFPEDYYLHGVVIDYGSLPGGYQVPFDLGRTLTHETGHYLGLYHTFQGGCTAPGDEVDDTPFEATPAAGCPIGRNTCPDPGDDPIHNYMDYTDDACYTEFTSGQDVRMDEMVPTYRPSLVNGAVAQAIARPATDESARHPLFGGSSLALAVSPNPFSAETDLSFSLPRAGAVSLRVYNVAGQLVATLLEGESGAGDHHVSFRARNLPAGMYFTRLRLDHEQVIRSVMLVP
jgi:hypothetical protein